MEEKSKKITIDYNGSMVKTTKVLGWLLFIIGVVGDLFFFFGTWDRDEIAWPAAQILIVTVLVFLSFLIISKILEHLLFIRRIHEEKSFHEGYEIKKLNDKY